MSGAAGRESDGRPGVGASPGVVVGGTAAATADQECQQRRRCEKEPGWERIHGMGWEDFTNERGLHPIFFPKNSGFEFFLVAGRLFARRGARVEIPPTGFALRGQRWVTKGPESGDFSLILLRIEREEFAREQRPRVMAATPSENSPSQFQALIDTLRREAVEEAEKEAEQILGSAEIRAAEILAKARREAGEPHSLGLPSPGCARHAQSDIFEHQPHRERHSQLAARDQAGQALGSAKRSSQSVERCGPSGGRERLQTHPRLPKTFPCWPRPWRRPNRPVLQSWPLPRPTLRLRPIRSQRNNPLHPRPTRANN